MLLPISLAVFCLIFQVVSSFQTSIIREVFNNRWMPMMPNSDAMIPLIGVTVNGSMIDFLGKINISQSFRNNYDIPIEAKYMFTLDDKSHVVGMSMIVGNRRLVSEIKEKTEARQEYEEAIKDHKRTSLLEKSSNGIYTINVGNIAAGEEVTIAIEYITELECTDEGEMKFVLPTNISPKYDSSNNKNINDMLADQATTSQLTYANSVPYKFQLNLDWESNQKIKKVYSLTNEIEVSERKTDQAQGAVNIQSKTTPAKGDFNLFLQTEKIGPAIYLESDEPTEGTEGETYLLLTNRIKEEEIPVKEGETQAGNFFIILDRSGSMDSPMNRWSGGDVLVHPYQNKMDFAREATELFIQSLPAGANFNVISFGSSYEPLFDRHTVPYTEENKNAALNAVRGFQANFGGTELFPCLQGVLTGEINRNGGIKTNPEPVDLKKREWTPGSNEKPKEASSSSSDNNVIILITDGDVTNPDAVIQLGKQFSFKYRIFTIGIGQDVNRQLVGGIAKEANAISEILVDNPDIGSVVAKMLDASSKAYYTSTSMKILGDTVAVEEGGVLYPNRFSSLYYRLPTSALEKLTMNSIEVTSINGVTGKPVSWTLPTPSMESLKQRQQDHHSKIIRQLYAASVIRQWEDKAQREPRLYQEAMKEIIALSVKYQIMNERTSFVVTDEEIVKSNLVNPMTVVVPQYNSFVADTSASGNVLLSAGRGLFSGRPSSQPSGAPAAQPSSMPSGCPSRQPTSRPTGAPSMQPSSQPSGAPVQPRNSVPTGCPSRQPSAQPSGAPACQPSSVPTSCPSGQPTSQPTGAPAMGQSMRSGAIAKEAGSVDVLGGSELEALALKKLKKGVVCVEIADTNSPEAFDLLLSLKHVDGSFDRNACTMYLIFGGQQTTVSDELVKAAIETGKKKITDISQSQGWSEETVFNLFVLNKWKTNPNQEQKKKFVMIIRNLEKWLTKDGNKALNGKELDECLQAINLVAV